MRHGVRCFRRINQALPSRLKKGSISFFLSLNYSFAISALLNQ
ncbi:hypothetical protein D931_03488 [Enterococcus faecium 13.SD.W.09]|nr:hypothetical protein D931_03488 [Enterococcus faecium 13.SD.W.09]